MNHLHRADDGENTYEKLSLETMERRRTTAILPTATEPNGAFRPNCCYTRSRRIIVASLATIATALLVAYIIYNEVFRYSEKNNQHISTTASSHSMASAMPNHETTHCSKTRPIFQAGTISVSNNILLQQHFNGSNFFNRSWSEMQHEQGHYSSDYWLGLEMIHIQTTSRRCGLQVALLANKTWHFDNYTMFKIDSCNTGYKMYISATENSETENSHLSFHNNTEFSTYDHDHDHMLNGNCAGTYGGGWWYKSCFRAGLNSSPNDWFSVYETRTKLKFTLETSRMLLHCS